MKRHFLVLFALSYALHAAEINGSLTLARITAPSAPATNFSTLSVNVTTGTIGCINADSTNCFNVNLSGAATPTLPNTTSFYVIGPSSGNSRELGIAYAGTAFHTGARYDGTPASPTAVQATEQIAGYNAFGYDGTTLGGPLASVRVFANQNFTASAHGSYMDFTTTPNGTTASAVVMRMEADAGITVPNTVTGGDKGAGTINAAGLFVNGVAVNTSSGLTINSTTISGGTTNALLYVDSGGVLQNAANVTRTAAGTLTFGTSVVSPLYTGAAAIAFRPGSDSTTAMQFGNATGTAFVTMDSTNLAQSINSGSGLYQLTLLSSSASGIRMLGGSVSQYNWLIDTNNSHSNFFELAPSTAAGGSTFATPVFVVHQSGAVGVGINSGISGVGVYIAGKSQSYWDQRSGTTFSVSGCATTSALTGGATAGSFATTTTGTCTAVVTMGSSATATNGWSCTVSDQTTGNLMRQTASTTTTATLAGTTVSGDTVVFSCVGY